MAHAVLRGSTEIGERNVIHPGAVLGGEPQDLAFAGGETFLRIGNDNVFREHATAASRHRRRAAPPSSATATTSCRARTSPTTVASATRTIVAGGALLAGHVELDDRAFVSGNCVVHQHVRIGTAGAAARSVADQSRRAAVLHHRRHPHRARRERDRSPACRLRRRADRGHPPCGRAALRAPDAPRARARRASRPATSPTTCASSSRSSAPRSAAYACRRAPAARARPEASE